MLYSEIPTIPLEYLASEIIEMQDILIIGNPEKSGLTTKLCQIASDLIFFNDNVNVLFVVESNRERANVISAITQIFEEEYFQLENKDNKILSCGSSNIVVYNYIKDSELMTTIERYDFSFFDCDANTKLANYWIADYLPWISKKIIITTNDFEGSIFYTDIPNEYKIKVYSERSSQNIKKYSVKEYTSLSKEHLIKGNFLNYISNEKE